MSDVLQQRTNPSLDFRPEGAPPRVDGWQTPRGRIVSASLLVVFVVSYPFLVTTSRWVDAANLMLIAAVGAIALNVLIGVAGQFSLGSAAFMALGAFAAAGVTTQLVELPFLLALVLGALVGGLAAIVLGVIALRIKGFYLLLATIALHYIVIFLAQRFQEPTVGVVGFRMPRAEIFGLTLARRTDWYWFLLVFLIAVAWMTVNLLRSRTGRAFRAVKDRDIAAAILGVDVTRTKMIAFLVTSMIISVQGVVYGYYLGVVTYESFTIDMTKQYVAMIIIGGIGTVSGGILGAVFVIGLPFVVEAVLPNLPAWFPFLENIQRNVFATQSVIYGVAILVFILKIPRGVAYGLRPAQRWLGNIVGGTLSSDSGRSDSGRETRR